MARFGERTLARYRQLVGQLTGEDGGRIHAVVLDLVMPDLGGLGDLGPGDRGTGQAEAVDVLGCGLGGGSGLGRRRVDQIGKFIEHAPGIR